MMKALARVAMVAILVLAGCGGSRPPVTDAPLTMEYKLAVINGNGASVGEADFAVILDQLVTGTATCAPAASRTAAADTIVASWQSGGSKGSLLDWARALASACR